MLPILHRSGWEVVPLFSVKRALAVVSAKALGVHVVQLFTLIIISSLSAVASNNDF